MDIVGKRAAEEAEGSREDRWLWRSRAEGHRGV
jgi:hypothetical protein